MRILVTGGAGFIGSHTVDALLMTGHRLRILDNFEKPVHLKGKPAYIPDDVEVIEGDVRNKADWERALGGINVVYHFAAYQDYLPDFGKFFHVNSVGTALLYEVAVEHRIPLKKVIVASSQAVYGEGKYQCSNDACQLSENNGIYYPDMRSSEALGRGDWEHRCSLCGQTMQPQLTDEARVNPQNQYAVSKYTQELIAFSLGKRYGIPTVALRYSIVQGPRQSFYNVYSGACRIFCLSYFLGKQPVVYEDGKQTRDFINISDVVNANLVVLDKEEADYQMFNVGGGKAYTILEFADTVRKVLGKEMLPRIPGEYRFGDTRHMISDISRLERLGWKPKHEPTKSVKDYVGWLMEQKELEDVLESAEQKMKEMNVVRMSKGLKEAV
jgi:dTDP-L-rhamnose 4-epimerase